MTARSKAKKTPGSEKTQRGDPPSVRRRLRRETEETRRTAAVILEVLGGVRTTQEAAGALEVSVARYYALEARAVEGLVKACRKRPKGPPRSSERRVKMLEDELDRLRSENSRTLALLRVAQRAVGVKALPERTKKEPAGGKKGRKRRPTTRALRAAALLRGASGGEKTVEGAVSPPEDGTERAS